jgi:hypothetical protein
MKAAEARRIPACDRHLNGIVSNRRRGGQKADGLALSMSFAGSQQFSKLYQRIA